VEEGEGTEAGEPAVAGARAAGGAVNGHADVLRRIDEICTWYGREEPSSPVPVLLRRAQRLVGKSFEEVLQDIAPGGMGEFSQIAGLQPE
jgi:type VI secretion system protein ImpA